MKKLILGLVFLCGFGLASTAMAFDMGPIALDNSVSMYVYNYDMVSKSTLDSETYKLEAMSVLTHKDWPGFVTLDWQADIAKEFDDITSQEFKATYGHPIWGQTLFALGRYSYLDYAGAAEANKTVSAGLAIRF